MTPAGVGDVTARIAEIRQRFAAPVGFQNVMTAAAQVGTDGAQPAQDWAPANAPVAAVAEAGAVAPPGNQPAAVAAAGTAPAGNWAARLPEAGKRWAGAIQAAAQRHGVEPELLASLVRAESGFNPAARSHAGAIGLAQLMPGTARGLGVDPHDPVANLEGGARYLREQLDRFGSRELALAAYNAGPTRVARAGGIPNISETQTYVRRVMGFYQDLKS